MCVCISLCMYLYLCVGEPRSPPGISETIERIFNGIDVHSLWIFLSIVVCQYVKVCMCHIDVCACVCLLRGQKTGEIQEERNRLASKRDIVKQKLEKQVRSNNVHICILCSWCFHS